MILMNDFKAEPAELQDAMRVAASRVISSGWYVLGPEVEAFESAWAKTCGVDHCVGVANGMDAIELILRGLDIGPGDEVITTTMTAFATVLAIMRAGATPVLADIDSETGLMSIQSAQRCISGKTRAVVLVHLYGQLRQMDEWLRFCGEQNVELIEDCAQSHLAASQGRVAGSIGVAGAYSFYPTKNLGALGDGGAVVTNSTRLAKRINMLRNYGQSKRYHHPEPGMNSRLDELQAALLIERLEWLEGFTQRRREVAAYFDRSIENPLCRQLRLPEDPQSHVHHLYVLRCDEPGRLAEHLSECGIQSLRHYPVPIHHQPPCRLHKSDPQGMTAAEEYALTCISIPCHPQLTDEDLERVVVAINAFC
jgi:dTDP-4-amino-4,6-dideoxygalactose transaminase